MTTRSSKYFRYYTYIEPVVKNPLIKTYGYAIFTIVMTIIFIFFAIKPTLETIVVLQKKAAVQKETLDKLNQKIETLGVAQKNYNSIDSALKSKIANFVPAKPEIADLINTLEGSVQNTTASISALQFQPVVLDNKPSTNKLEALSFTFNVEGSYESIKQVLQNLYSGARLLTIESLSFNKVASGSLLMTISGKAYYLK